MPDTIGGASPSNPGAGGVFESLGPLFDPGYHVVFQPQLSNKQPSSPPAFSDPRGILPSGLAPASTISYEIVDSPTELVIMNNSENSAAGVSLGFLQVGGELTAVFQSVISLIFFEGKDVIDLPTDGLDTSQGGITVPDKVFLPIYAGGKFINSPTDDFGTKASLEYIFPSSSNQVQGVVPSINPPLDSFSNSKCVIPNFAVRPVIDVASNTIKTKGPVQFVSYVAATKPLFRDVVFMNSSAIADGTFAGNDFTISTVAPFGDPIVQVLRYAFINVSPPNTPAYMQWRLSESFGVQPASTSPDPSGVGNGVAAAADEKGLHFVYDLTDDSPDIATTFPLKPIKKGISAAFATAKMDPTSRYFDKNFKAQIIPPGKNSFFFQSRLSVKRVFGLSNVNRGTAPNSIESDRVYQSPVYQVNVTQNTRVGLEYAIHHFGRTSVYAQEPAIILAATKPAAQGISAYYDPCIKQTLVFMVEEATVAQRSFNDKTWAVSTDKTLSNTIPDSQLKAFLLGESPMKSEGPAAFFPKTSKLVDTSGSKNDVALPAGTFPTGVIVSLGSDATPTKIPVLQLFSDSGSKGTPVLEIAMPYPKDVLLFLSTPPITVKSFNISNGSGSVISFYGCKKDFLPDMALPKAPQGQSLDTFGQLSSLQFSANKAEVFPINSNSLCAAVLSEYGFGYVVYENNGRIDIAFRRAQNQPFLILRDIAFRIPENLNKSDLSSNPRIAPSSTRGTFPTASNPFMIPVPQTSSLFIFYIYKNRLVMKTLSHFTFADIVAADSKGITNPLSADTEAAASAILDAAIPVVVYDGNLSDPQKDAKADVTFGTLIFPPKKQATSSTTTTSQTSVQIAEHAACRTTGGILFCFIQDGQRIRVRRSFDAGRTWNDVFSDTTTFLPPIQPKKGLAPTTATNSTVTDGDSPFCYYDEGTSSILFFMMSDNCLLYLKLPEKMLMQQKTDADKSLDEMTPTIIFGKISDDLKDRGVIESQAVLDRKKAAKDSFNESISPQRIAVTRLESGHLRLFFTDQQQILRSLVSSDDGNQWQTEDQYISNR